MVKNFFFEIPALFYLKRVGISNKGMSFFTLLLIPYPACISYILEIFIRLVEIVRESIQVMGPLNPA